MTAKPYDEVSFSGTEGLRALIPSMDRAELRHVHVEGCSSPEEPWDPHLRAMVNTRTNRPCMTVSPIYKPLQHGDFYAMVADELESNGVKLNQGYVTTISGGNVVKVRATIDGEVFREAKGGSDIKVGLSFTNSYNSNNSAYGCGYFVRHLCQNQFKLANVIPDCMFSRNHVAKSEVELMEAVRSRIMNFTDSVTLVAGDKVNEVIARAANTPVVFMNREQLVETMKGITKSMRAGDKVTDLLIEEVGDIDNTAIDRYTLFNAITNYATHGGVSPQVQDRMFRAAEVRVLDVRNALIPAEIVIPVAA